MSSHIDMPAHMRLFSCLLTVSPCWYHSKSLLEASCVNFALEDGADDIDSLDSTALSAISETLSPTPSDGHVVASSSSNTRGSACDGIAVGSVARPTSPFFARRGSACHRRVQQFSCDCLCWCDKLKWWSRGKAGIIHQRVAQNFSTKVEAGANHDATSTKPSDPSRV